VSTQSFRNHRQELQAFDLIRETKTGWVVCLPYREVDVDDDGLPYYALVDETPHSDRKLDSGLREESLQGALYEAIVALEDSHVLRDITNPVTQPIYGRLSEDDLPTLLKHRPSWSGLVEFVVALREGDPLGIGDERTPTERITMQGTQSTATIGRPPDQASLSSFEAEQTAEVGKPAHEKRLSAGVRQ